MPRTAERKRSYRSHTKQAHPRSRGRICYAIVGLGHIAQIAVLPAFAHAKENSELAALVSGSPRKLDELGQKYKVKALYRYEELEECINREEIDAVYIALPNTLHYDFVRRAMSASAHVLCEKPLATSSRECRELDRAARSSKVYLMTAYRLHFDKANMTVVGKVQRGEIGEPRIFTSVFSFQIKSENIRLESELGGGVLFDLGVYPLNAARYIFQNEPIAVSGYTLFSEDDRFSEVEGTAAALLLFPEGRIAQLTCSFASDNSSYFEIIGTQGKIRLESAFEYAAGATMIMEKNGESEKLRFGRHDQFAAELIYFSNCILSRQPPEPSAHEGEQDLRIIEAIRYSNRRGITVALDPSRRRRYANESQIIERPPITPPKEIAASSPAQK